MDTNASSAWLYVTSGCKEWACTHAKDHDAIVALGAPGKDGEGLVLPDLFAADVLVSSYSLYYEPSYSRGCELFDDSMS